VKAFGDRSRLYVIGLAASWVAFVALPLGLSTLLGRFAFGLPLLGVGVWFVALRIGRLASPPARCERLLSHGQFEQAIALCESELAVTGEDAWLGTRRLAWLNRLSTALTGVGRYGAGLVLAVEALAAHPNPETLTNCAQCLLWLNRHGEAEEAAHLALNLTRGRSVNANAVVATVALAKGLPAEAEAAARSGLSDVEALLPFVQPAHQAALLAALCRAERELGEATQAAKHLRALRRAGRHNPLLQAQALMEEADALASGAESTRLEALERMSRAASLAPHYVCWYLSQPATLYEVRGEAMYRATLETARATWQRALPPAEAAAQAGAPSRVHIAIELAAAAARGYSRPARHASWAALVIQACALVGTLGLLIWWTWRFFILGA
jgi:tetratricopeptide (TPR) repeat protein